MSRINPSEAVSILQAASDALSHASYCGITGAPVNHAAIEKAWAPLRALVKEFDFEPFPTFGGDVPPRLVVALAPGPFCLRHRPEKEGNIIASGFATWDDAEAHALRWMELNFVNHEELTPGHWCKNGHSYLRIEKEVAGLEIQAGRAVAFGLGGQG